MSRVTACSFHIQHNCRIRSARHVNLVVFGLLPKLPLPLQTALLDTVAAMMRHHRSNLDVCGRVGLCRSLMGLLTSPQLRSMLEASSSTAAATTPAGAGPVAPPPRTARDGSGRVPGGLVTAPEPPPRAGHAGAGASEASSTLLADADKMGLLRRIVRIVAIVGSHTASLRDLQVFLRPVVAVKELPPGVAGTPEHSVVADMLLQALESMARTGSEAAGYFDLAGAGCGVNIPDMPVFPRSGFTLAMWIRLERLPSEVVVRTGAGAQVPEALIASFGGPTGNGIQLAVRHRTVVYRVHDSGEVRCLWWMLVCAGAMWSTAPAAVASRCWSLILRSTPPLPWCAQATVVVLANDIDVGTWMWLCVVHQPKTFWRDRVLLYRDGRFEHQAKLAYPPASSMRPVRTATVGGYVLLPMTSVAARRRHRWRVLFVLHVHRFEGQLASVTMFGAALGPDDVQAVWNASSTPSMAIFPPATNPTQGTVQLSRSLYSKVVVSVPAGAHRTYHVVRDRECAQVINSRPHVTDARRTVCIRRTELHASRPTPVHHQSYDRRHDHRWWAAGVTG